MVAMRATRLRASALRASIAPPGARRSPPIIDAAIARGLLDADLLLDADQGADPWAVIQACYASRTRSPRNVVGR